MPVVQEKKIAKPVQAALSVIEKLRADNPDLAKQVANKLPGLAMQIEKSGQDITEEILHDHALQGSKHIESVYQELKQSVVSSNSTAKTYDDIIANLKISSEEEPSYDRHNLIEVARRGDLEQVKHLVEECNADISVSDHYALDKAAENGHINVVKYLVEECGYDANLNDNLCLKISAINGRLELVQYLVEEHNASYNNDDFRLLYAMVKGGYLDVIKYLTEEAEFKIELDDHHFLEEAAENGNLDLVQYLVNEFDVNVRANNCGALDRAVKKGHLNIVKYLLDKANIDLSISNYRFLDKAAEAGHLDVVKFLVEQGADISNGNFFALTRAVANQHLDVVEYLLPKVLEIETNNFKKLETMTKDRFRSLSDLGELGKIKDLKSRIVCSAYNKMNYALLKSMYEHGFLMDFLKEKQQSYVEPVFKKMDKWKNLHGNYPPQGLEELNPYIFKPKSFKAAQKMIKKEGYKGKQLNHYAYDISSLLRTEDRILNYLEKWGEAGKQPLHDIVYMISIPETGKPDLKAWGDAVLKFGPEMAKLVQYSDRIEKPLSSLNKTREEASKFAYDRAEENQGLANLCFSYLVDGSDFDDALDLVGEFNKKAKKISHIPDITINGNKFDMDGAKFYKLPDGDIRGLFLGEITDCCQSIGGEGEECARHGFESPNGGFYVIEKDNRIIGQTWAWRGQNDELVFDSLETLGGRVSKKQWQKIAKEFAKELPKAANDVTVFKIGGGGGTPSLEFSEPSKLANPKGYDGYSDSETNQYRVWKR